MGEYRDVLEAEQYYFAADIDTLVQLCGGLAKEAGWDNAPLDVPKALMLTVSELAEAMEGDRKSLQDDKLPQYAMLNVELADAVIRIFHLVCRLEKERPAGSGGGFGEILTAKLIYNTQREDHKLEVRNATGGKSY